MSRTGGLIPSARSLLIGLVVLVLQLPAPAQQPSATEDQVKAAYLLNFAKLGEWPHQTLPDGPSPLVIGVSGADQDFLKALTTLAAGKTSGTHPLLVKSVSSNEEMKSCHIVFFRTTEQKHTRTDLADLAVAGILSVGEDPAFLRQGGMINLLRDHGTVRFEINSDSLDLSKIHFPSKILALAKASEGPASTASAAPAEGERRVETSAPPEYPALAQQMKLTGTVRVQARVKPNGSVTEVTVLGGHPLLAAALADAVRQWKYQPAPKETLEVVKFSFGPQ
jgi:TonB family protein